MHPVVGDVFRIAQPRVADVRRQQEADARFQFEDGLADGDLELVFQPAQQHEVVERAGGVAEISLRVEQTAGNVVDLCVQRNFEILHVRSFFSRRERSRRRASDRCAVRSVRFPPVWQALRPVR